MRNKGLAAKRPQKKIYGYYLTMDLYDCKPETVGDIERCYSYLDKLPRLLEVEKLSPPFVVRTDGDKYPDKAGLSCWIPLTDSKNGIYSGISVHTLTPTNFISIDIYSPKKFNREKVQEFTLTAFQPREIESQYFLRGDSLQA
jgi:S-adenosylmethionine/arginine decarboxylase-like enzyme